MTNGYQLDILVEQNLFLAIIFHSNRQKPIKSEQIWPKKGCSLTKFPSCCPLVMTTNQNFLLVAVSHGYQVNNKVGSQELSQVLHFYQETVNFTSPSGKKFHRTNIACRALLFLCPTSTSEFDCREFITESALIVPASSITRLH